MAFDPYLAQLLTVSGAQPLYHAVNPAVLFVATETHEIVRMLNVISIRPLKQSVIPYEVNDTLLVTTVRLGQFQDGS